MPNLSIVDTPQILKSPEHLISETLMRMYLTWRELAGTRFAPSRKEIAPSRFKTALGEIFLVDVIDAGADFRFSLGGNGLVMFLKNRLARGMYLSEISGSIFYKRALRVFGHCVDTKEPVATGPAQVTLEGREFLQIEVLVLPLSDAAERVTSLIGAIHTSPLAPQTNINMPLEETRMLFNEKSGSAAG